MRQIMVLNSKGGSGKSTIATSLAAYYAGRGENVALVDYDRQASSLEWLDRRPENRPKITGVAGFDSGFRSVPRNTDVAIIDAPAGCHGTDLTALVRHAETVVVPVLPSTIDITASGKFIDELQEIGKVERKEVKLAVVGNRVREYTLISQELDEYLTALRMPYVTRLREAQNYVRAYTRGLGIHELPEYLAWPDWEQWKPLVSWLNSKRSQPG
ncbi:MAG: chromosome partitioning protein [Gammaproteobacteria bacterium PRO9]|nr:chromosome partitioning protein [Gammaproteobacteria bacterium PRO9]